MKRRRVSSEGERPPEAGSGGCAPSSCPELKPDTREALTPASTSDTETRDSSVIDPGTEQDPHSPESVSPKEEKMEASSSSSSSSSLPEEVLPPGPPVLEEEEEEQPAVGGGKVEEGEGGGEEGERLKEEPEPGAKTCGVSTSIEDVDLALPSTSVLAGIQEAGEAQGCPLQEADAASLVPGYSHVASHGLLNLMQRQDVWDTLCRTVEAAISALSKHSASKAARTTAS